MCLLLQRHKLKYLELWGRSKGNAREDETSSVPPVREATNRTHRMPPSAATKFSLEHNMLSLRS